MNDSTDGTPTRTEAPAALDERLAALWDLWVRKHRDARLPSRGDFDPLEMVRLLPFVFLVDVVERKPMVLRYRLIGTGIVNAVGRDDTGRLVEETNSGDTWKSLEAGYRTVVVDGVPNWRWRDATRADGRPFRFQEAILPLARDGRSVDMILGGAVHAE